MPSDRVTLAASITVASLFVDPNGAYAGLPGVEIWDEARDARTYAGPHPVVAHPPCSRWCQLAGFVEARYGYKRGEDGGCFEAALRAVQTWGGVLEHPAYSDAWAAFGIPRPDRRGGWLRTFDGGWTCQVEQSRYGHVAKKATWLYVHGIDKPPRLRWGYRHVSDGATIGDLWKHPPACGNHTRRYDKRPRVGKKAASATPEAFRDVLLEIARAASAAHVHEDPERCARALLGREEKRDG